MEQIFLFHQLLDRAALRFQLRILGRLFEPHLACAGDLSQVKHLFGQLGQEPFIVPKGSVTSHPLAREKLALPNLGAELERQLRFGLKADFLGHAALFLSSLLVVVAEPALGQIKARVQQRMSLGAGITDEHP